jgi:DNA-directed RNA polymerase alpha subunit
MSGTKQFSSDEAKRIGVAIGIDWDQVDLEEFRVGLAVELEHGSIDPETNVTDDDEILTGKIALAHLREFPDYYTRLEKMEEEADEYWGQQEDEG